MHRRELAIVTDAIRQQFETYAQQPNEVSHRRMAAVEAVATRIAQGFKTDNPSFRTDLFYKACGIDLPQDPTET